MSVTKTAIHPLVAAIDLSRLSLRVRVTQYIESVAKKRMIPVADMYSSVQKAFDLHTTS